MKFTGTTPSRIKKIHFQGSQHSSTCHFDDSQGVPKSGLWFHVERDNVGAADERPAADASPSGAHQPVLSF